MNNKKIRIAAYVVLGLLFASESYGDDLLAKFHPYISVVGEYNDNIYRTRDNKTSDWITTIRPGISFSNTDAQSGVDLSYFADVVRYADNSDRNYIGHNANLNAKYLTRSHWNFYLNDTYVRSNEPDEPSQLETIYSPAIQTNRYVYWRNIFSPTVEYQYGKENRVGLTYRNTEYSNEDPSSYDSREHYINPTWTHWINQRNGFQAQYGYVQGVFDRNSNTPVEQPDMTGHMGSLRYMYRWRTNSVVYIDYLYLTRDFDSLPGSPYQDYKVNNPKVGFTYALNPTLTLTGEGGYYRKEPETGESKDGPTYNVNLTQKEQKTTYSILLQGGYSEDYFTSENLGFVRYNRLVVSVQHRVTPKFTLGGSGSFARTDVYDPNDPINPDRTDDVWGISAGGSYMLYKWLSVSLNLSRQERSSSVAYYDYTEYKGVASITATY